MQEIVCNFNTIDRTYLKTLFELLYTKIEEAVGLLDPSEEYTILAPDSIIQLIDAGRTYCFTPPPSFPDDETYYYGGMVNKPNWHVWGSSDYLLNKVLVSNQTGTVAVRVKNLPWGDPEPEEKIEWTDEGF